MLTTTFEGEHLPPLGLSSEFSSLNDRVRALESEALERVIWRLVEQDGVPEAAARVLREEFLRFVSIVFVSDDLISPSPLVDKFWHAFILHTRDYEAFCQHHFGKFIHHEPKDHTLAAIAPKDQTPGLYTKSMIEKMFPGHDSEVWRELAICSRSHCDRGACRRA